MKNSLSVVGVLLFCCQLGFAQSAVDSLMQAGIEFHDKGQYADALVQYGKALEIDPGSSMVHYEIALTCMYAKEYEKALTHAQKVIDLDDKMVAGAFDIKGSSLDYMEKTDEAVRAFESGIKKFPDQYLLHYNLALTRTKRKEIKKAEEALLNALKINPNHPGSHLLLGYIKSDAKQRVQSLLCLHYFLLLEPNSQRAGNAYAVILEQSGRGVEQNADRPNEITITIDTHPSGKEFEAAEMMISVLKASAFAEENKNKSDDQLFRENTTSFFNVLGELKKPRNKGLWWDNYVPFFYDLAKSKHMEAYCFHIGQSVNPGAKEWIANNAEKMNAFLSWLNDRKLNADTGSN
jgi:tetratricopeptide (TPR) repeat protein